MIPVALIIFTGGLMLTLMVLWLARSASLEEAHTHEQLLRPGAETLVYDVPPGQDPAEIMVALRLAGYHSVEDTSRTAHRILVACPSGRSRDRGHVRAVIGTVDPRNPADVRFADERTQAAS